MLVRCGGGAAVGYYIYGCSMVHGGPWEGQVIQYITYVEVLYCNSRQRWHNAGQRWDLGVPLEGTSAD